MRRLAGPLIFVVGALFVIFSALLMLQKSNSNARESEKTREYILSEKIVVSEKPQSMPSPTPFSIPTVTNTPTPTSMPSPTPTKTSSPEENNLQENQNITNAQEESHKDYILRKINEYRSSQGLSAASSNTETCSFARTRAGEIPSNFNHDPFSQKISSNTLPYPSYSLVTENIAMTQNYQDVVSIWINSGPHAENMRKDTPFICVEQNGNYFAYEGWKP